MIILTQMKSFKPFLLIFALSGLIWACETSAPFVNDVQVGLVTGDYESALTAVNEALAADSLNSIAHYYKGVTLGAQAASIEEPAERRPVYQEARSSFDTAERLMESAEELPAEYEEMSDEIVALWAEEFNQGVNILNDDSLNAATPEPNLTAIAHFHNAATIQPDSAVTYQVLSSTYYQENEVEEAIGQYENAMELLELPEADDYEYIISLYLYDEQYDRAIELSEEALENYPDESIFVQFLADGYIQSGERDQAIELVQDLIEEEPDNAQYRRVLGTQVYQAVDEIANRVSELYEEQFDLNQQARNQEGSELENTQAQIEQNQAEITRMESEIDELVQISINEMTRVTELEPNSESAHYILGIIYQNLAANLFERRNNTTDNAEVEEYDNMARENLEQALVHYERAAEINPDDPENWQSLFQVYTALGMEEEAQEAMEKANF